MDSLISKYADLLCNYCLDLQKGEKLYVHSSTLAIPLLKEIYRCAISMGVYAEIDIAFDGKGKIFMDNADDELLKSIPTLRSKAIEEFDAYLIVRAPFNLMEGSNSDPEKKKKRQQAMGGLSDTYFKRTASGELKRSLCQFPTHASAQAAGMSLEEYENFVYNACRLYADNPASEWLQVR